VCTEATLDVDSVHTFLEVTDGAVVAHAAVVPRVIEVDALPLRSGCVEGVATAPNWQREGFGTAAMTEAADLIRCELEMGALSTGEHEFYERLGRERWQGSSFARRLRDDANCGRGRRRDGGPLRPQCGNRRGCTDLV
jgi:GNAT superfamily N-acetyltransferase